MTDIPGLPSLPAATAGLFSAVTLLTGDAVSPVGGQNSQWGIFLNGDPVVEADNVLSMEFKQDFKISNYPVEQGAFSSYNKVQMPFEVRFRFSTGGSSADRSAMLSSIAAVIGDTNLYDVVTPDATYMNVNFVHQDYRRTAQEGAGLLSVDVGVEEIRSASLIVSNTSTSSSSSAAPSGTGGTTLTNTTNTDSLYDGINMPQTPSASPQVNGGSVQPATPSTAEVSQFNNAMPLP